MEKNNILQVILGTIVVFIVAFIFLFLNTNHNFLKKQECYQVFAKFNNISGLSVGSTVKIYGVNVGKVYSISLNTELEKVLVSICINNGVNIPSDTTAIISSENFLSNTKFINLVLGVSNEFIQSGDYITMTQSPLNFEDLIKNFIMNRA
jgi:phospholipid/cholesterol/gamma-HCH transport system substrate-binding protein